MDRFLAPAVEQVLDLVPGEPRRKELGVGDDAVLRRPQPGNDPFVSHPHQYSDAL